MKIVIDAFGGDYSPEEIVKGAVTAANLIDEVDLILTGDLGACGSKIFKRVLKSEGYNLKKYMDFLFILSKTNFIYI